MSNNTRCIKRMSWYLGGFAVRIGHSVLTRKKMRESSTKVLRCFGEEEWGTPTFIFPTAPHVFPSKIAK